MRRLMYVTGLVLTLCLSGFAAFSASVAGTSWRVVTIDGSPVISGTELSVSFTQDGEVFGDGGCNKFRGRYVENGSAILFSPLAATMMVCDQAISEQELMFFEVMSLARGFDQSETGLTLLDSSGKPGIELEEQGR